MKTKRTRIFSVSPNFIMALLSGFDGETKTVKLMCDGIPEDAMLVGAHYDFNENSFKILVSHETFPEVSEGSSSERMIVWFDVCGKDAWLEMM